MKPIQAGKLDKVITVQRATTTFSDTGGPIEAWADLMTIRAERLSNSAAEYLRTAGESSEAVAVFRIWWRDINLLDRIQFEGRIYNIIELVEIGRRGGWELRCKSVT